MSTTPVDRLAHLGRAALLVGALLALGALWLWTEGEEYVEAYDAGAVEAHVKQARDLDARAQSLEPGGGSHRFIKLGLLVAEMLRDTRPGERLGPQRRRALEHLTRHRERTGDLPGALESAREWVEFEPLSLYAALDFARLLGQSPELREERLEVLGELFGRLPDVDEVARAWCELLMDEGRYLEAIEAARVSDRQARPNFWRVRWKRREAATTPFQAMIRPTLTADGQLLVECSIAGPALWISLELPPGGRCTLLDPVVTITKKGDSTDFVLADIEGLSAPSLVRSGRSFVQDGQLGSRFVIEPGRAALDPQPTIALRAGLQRPPSSGVLAVALHPQADLAFELLHASDRGADLELFRTARLSGLMQGQAQVYWRKRKGGFTAANSMRVHVGGTLVDGALTFEVEFPIAERVSLIRLDLPEGRGIVYESMMLEVLTESGSTALDLGTLELELLHGMERDEQQFTVTGPDPWIAFSLPGPVATVEQLRLRGVAR